jgi:hypothetical protein
MVNKNCEESANKAFKTIQKNLSIIMSFFGDELAGVYQGQINSFDNFKQEDKVRLSNAYRKGLNMEPIDLEGGVTRKK